MAVVLCRRGVCDRVVAGMNDRYGGKQYADLQHTECLDAMRQGKMPADPRTVARYFQALAWRLDQLDAKIDQLRKSE